MGSWASSIDDQTIVYAAAGTGPDLVLVHGWSCDRSYWRNQLDLAKQFRVVSIDLAGHGDSSADRVEWTMASFGDDVIAVIDALAASDVVLVGHSMGGNACLEAARRLGDRVRGIVWVDTYGRLDVPRSAGSVDELVAPFESDFDSTTRTFVGDMFVAGEDPAIAEWMVDDMSAAPPNIAVATIRASLSYGRRAHRFVGDVASPIVAINTDYLDTDVQSLEGHGVEVRRLHGTGHFGMLTAPERFNALLEDTITSW